MIVREIFAKSVLSKSQVYDYAINPYVGCSHSCRYCYAAFMRRFTGHKEKWGEFVDVKINAPELLAGEIKIKRTGRVWVSGVCDPYQAAEKRYRLTRRCLEILLENQWPVIVQTKSSLLLRDVEIMEKSKDIEVGFSITTADEKISDRLNYFYANRIYIENDLEWAKEDHFFIQQAEELKKGFERKGVPVQVLF